jgi:hypothetical protein
MEERSHDAQVIGGGNWRWFRFSLRTLLLLLTVVGIWLGYTVNAARRQRAAVNTLQGSGVTIMYDYMETAARTWSTSGKPSGPDWLRNALGLDYFHYPVYASVRSRVENTNDIVAALYALPGLKTLMLAGDSINDETIGELGPLDRLEELHITAAHVTDRGLKQLLKFPRLQWLIFNDVPITDAGCATLAELSNLEELRLYGSDVSDDALIHLKKLHKLRRLTITKTRITYEGAEALRKALPRCTVYY